MEEEDTTLVVSQSQESSISSGSGSGRIYKSVNSGSGSSDSESESVFEEDEEGDVSQLNEEAMVRVISKALGRKEIRDKIASSVVSVLNSRITKMEKRIKTLESLVSTNKKEISATDTARSKEEQYSRRVNLKFSGFDEKGKEEVCEDRICEFVKEALEVDLTPEDISIAHRIGVVKDGVARPILVKFIADKKKRMVYQSRVKLAKKEGMKDYYVNEDLTKIQSELFYKARKAIDRKRGHKTWTESGTVYIKLRKDDPPIKIDSISRLNEVKNSAKLH